jgi:predicted RNA-binding Zn-ribbon protein involved in translation (DUF1610 family)
LSYDNVKLWFARNTNNDVITIDDITEDNKNNTYSCPMCGSNLIPKAIKSTQVTSHFAHVDASKCNSETMIHWWFKNKFLEKGDSFTIISDKERTYICKEIMIEHSIETSERIYQPDVTVITECGNTIYFEMDYSNKKQVKDYIDIWLELKNIVVEVDIKKLMLIEKVPKFKALFYNGKCFNVKKNDTYYNTIGKYKEEKFKNGLDKKIKERVQKLDWFWDDLVKYKKGEVNIEQIFILIDNITRDERIVLKEILQKQKCNDILQKYIDYKLDYAYSAVCTKVKEKYGEDFIGYIGKVIVDKPDITKNNLRIKILSLKNNRWYYYSINDIELLLNRVNDYLNENSEYHKNKVFIDHYNNKAKEIKNKIDSSNSFTCYNSELSLRGYRIYVSVDKITSRPNSLNESYFDISKINITFILKYSYREVLKIKLKKSQEDVNIEQICTKIIDEFRLFFLSIDPLKDIDKMDNLSKTIEDSFAGCKIIRINKSVLYEDIYEITVIFDRDRSSTYFITNSGVLRSSFEFNTRPEIKSFRFKSSNLGEIEKYLINDIGFKLKEKTKRNCSDCNEDFTLEIGEIKFFNNKGFEFPKRCKSCRELKKKNKDIS